MHVRHDTWHILLSPLAKTSPGRGVSLESIVKYAYAASLHFFELVTFDVILGISETAVSMNRHTA